VALALTQKQNCVPARVDPSDLRVGHVESVFQFLPSSAISERLPFAPSVAMRVLLCRRERGNLLVNGTNGLEFVAGTRA
jgi:hypothetical protein